MRDPQLEEKFPKLRGGGYSEESPRDPKYNCVAFAVGDLNRYWQYMGPGRTKGYFWPTSIRQDDTVESWAEVFRLYGYKPSANAEFEPGVEKVAIYVDDEDVPTHVAKQDVKSGKWVSKLGKGKDISHDTLELLVGDEGDEYGRVERIMERPYKLESVSNE